MTEALPFQKESVPNHGELDNMEMTCAFPKEIKRKSVSTSDANSSMKISKPDESGMEMTESLPFQKESVPDHGELDNMEMTCALPMEINGKKGSNANVSSTIKVSKPDESG